MRGRTAEIFVSYRDVKDRDIENLTTCSNETQQMTPEIDPGRGGGMPTSILLFWRRMMSGRITPVPMIPSQNLSICKNVSADSEEYAGRATARG